jgi:hypothetical protein
MAKRKSVRDRMVGNFEVIQHKNIAGHKILIYCCLRCTRAWQLPDPCESWRVKSLITHAEAHNSHISRALSLADEAAQAAALEKSQA